MIKSLILILVLSGATLAGEMPQLRADPPPPPIPQQATANTVTMVLVAIVQTLLPLR